MLARIAPRFALVAMLFAAGAAHAQLFRAYLASDGADTNPCTLPQPCRLLPAALAAVASGGEIWMLDSANYNAAMVNIGKSVSVLAVPGAVGSLVAVSGAPALMITTAGLKVSLRNVVIGPLAGVAAGTDGVSMTAASSLAIEKSVIANLPGAAVRATAAGTLRITETTLRNNGDYAIWLENGAAAVIASSRLLDNANGLSAWSYVASATTTASLTDSVISGRGMGNGVVAFTSAVASAVAHVSVSRSVIERTGVALRSDTSGVGIAETTVGGSLIAENLAPWQKGGAGSQVLSLGNNQMIGNGAPIGAKVALTPQ
jgi:hypothetical protein